MSMTNRGASPASKRNMKSIGFSLAVGAIVLTVVALQYGIVFGLIGAGVIWTMTAVTYFLSDRSETLSIMGGQVSDERAVDIRTRAAARSFVVGYHVLVVAFLVALLLRSSDTRLLMVLVFAAWSIWYVSLALARRRSS
jgi:uncharacterized membrane protein